MAAVRKTKMKNQIVLTVVGHMNGDAFLATTPENLAKHPWMMDDGEELYSVWGINWTECMKKYYEIEGRGVYTP